MPSPLFEILKDKCQLCYACVRVCPVKAIEVKVNQKYVTINNERCIGCGKCLKVCSPGAIKYRDSKEDTKEFLKSDYNVAAIVAPSISGEFDDIRDYRKFVMMIKALGFDYVNEVSFGADLVAKKYEELFNNFKGKYYITSKCPVVVAYIEKFHPDLVKNLAPIVTPMIATAKVVHKKYGNNTKVVYIGPCIASKDEALDFDDDGKIDAVLTFHELRELFKEENITESSVEFSDFDAPIGMRGSLFPLTNGMIQSTNIDVDLLKDSVISIDGKSNVIESVNEFEKNIEMIKQHFDLFFCDGCIMGPGTSPNVGKFLRHTLVVNYANKRLKNFNKNNWDKDISEYSDLNIKRSFKKDDRRISNPSENEIDAILKTIEKYNDSLGCGSCGYKNCREFAIAVCQGLAKTEMCAVFAIKNRNEYINKLKVTNDALAKTKIALKQSKQKAVEKQKLAEQATEVVDIMMQKLPIAIVIIDENLKVLKSNDSFIRILGKDAEEISEIIPGLIGADLKSLLPFAFYNLFSFVMTKNENIINRDVDIDKSKLNVSVFTIKKNSIVGAVIRDMYAPEVRKEEAIKRVTEVIDRNLELVQKIGFTLGEGASETEKMLNSIIEFYKSGKSNK